MTGGLTTSPPPFSGGHEAAREVRESLIPSLLKEFPQGVAQLPTPFDLPQLGVEPDRLRPLAERLRERGFNLLLDVGGADYLPRRPRFEVIYHLLALPQLWRLRLRVALEGERPELPSVGDLWPCAHAAECEVFDQFGIRFTGHPNLRRVLNPPDWEGHPLRRDYPLQGPRAVASQTPPAERNRFHPIKLDRG